MKFSKIIASIVLAAAFAAPLAAVSAELKVGVVIVPRLLQESPQARAAMGALQDEFAPRQRELVALDNELKEKQAKFQRDVEVMSEEERRNAERDLQNDVRAFQRRQNEFAEDLDLRRNEVLGGMQQALGAEIQKFAETSGYDLIITDAVYFNDSLDITDEVLAGLEKNFQGGQ